MKICPVGAQLFHADRQIYGLTHKQAGRHEQLIVAFRSFAYPPAVVSLFNVIRTKFVINRGVDLSAVLFHILVVLLMFEVFV